MTIEKKPLISVSEQLTPSELAIVNEKLDVAIKSKEDAGLLQFSPSDEIADPNSSVNLSMFGLKDSDSLRRFILTPAGETVTHEIGAELSLERAIEEEHQLQIQEEMMMHERRKGLLFLWLLEEEAEAKKAQDELIQHQDEILKNNEENIEKKKTASAPAKKENKSLEEALKSYESSIKHYQEQQKVLEKEEKDLTKKLDKLEEESKAIDEKHQTYENVLNAYDKSASTYEKNPEMLDREIAVLERQMDRLTQHISDELDKGNEKEARKLLNQQNALNLQMGTLLDIKSKQSDQKVFLDADLKSDGVTYDKALFALPKEQAERLVKHNGEYLLLDKGEKLEDIKDDPTKLQNAKARFEKAKPEIMSVKNVVHHVKKQEIDHNANQIDEARSKIAVNKAEQLMVKNQINLMQSARANAQQQQQQALNANPASPMQPQQQALNANPALPMEPPPSTIIPSKSFGRLGTVSMPTATPSQPTPTPMSSQQPIFNAQAFVQTVNSMQKPVRFGPLFNLITTIQNRDAQNAADQVLTDAANDEVKNNDNLMNELTKEEQEALNKNPDSLKEKIKNMVLETPVPEKTMNDFLQNMPRYGQDAYKDNVTPEVSPIEMQANTPSVS